MGRTPKMTDAERVQKSAEQRALINRIKSEVISTDDPDELSAQYGDALYAMTPCDVTSIKAVKKRITDYIDLSTQYKQLPTFPGLAVALGVNKRALYDYATGRTKKIPDAVVNELNHFRDWISDLYERRVLTGKMQPVGWIFSSKNWLDYRDQVEIVATDNRVREQTAEQLIEEAKMLGNDESIDGDGTVE